MKKIKSVRTFSNDRFISSSNNLSEILTENYFKKEDEENSDLNSVQIKSPPNQARITRKTYLELLKNNIFNKEKPIVEKKNNGEDH